jgi:dTDP-4-amino-4,6-dideoxygalactose transaminase
VFLEKKRENYESYRDALEYVDGYEIVSVPTYAKNNHWLTILRITKEIAPKNLDTILDLFKEKNIEVRPIWLPNHLQKPYINAQGYKIEQAENIVRRSVCLPSGFNLTNEHVTRVVSCLAG